MIKRILKCFIIIIFLLVVNSCIKNEQAELNDGFINEYVLDIPFVEYESYKQPNILYLSLKDDFNLDYIGDEFKKKGYIIRFERVSDIECVILGIQDNQKIKYLYQVYKTSNRHVAVKKLCIKRGGVLFPFPYYMFDNIDYLSSTNLVDEDIFNECFLEIETNISFSQIVDFYQNSLTEIIQIDDVEKYMIVYGIDKKINDFFNSYVKIQYFEKDNISTIKIERIREY